MSQVKVLVVDDEIEIRELLKDYLEEENYRVKTCGDGEEALKLFKIFKPDIAILDIMLPGMDGIGVCLEIRKKSTLPIIMLSAKGREVDKILGLGFGADDYVVKPFSPKEVVARVKSQLRRSYQFSISSEFKNEIEFRDLSIDPSAYIVSLKGQQIDFTTKEFELLLFLARHNQKVLTRQQIYDGVWGFNEYGDLNTVTIHVKKIREKLTKVVGEEKDYIQTIWGVGYKFEGEEL
ncbi:response regulator transcription factor [Vagococcus acidifermentans]|uniref:DNA-binding response regulator n=1 Tax=Vagococcus acidifermentans TaxID=564710 RepID=A0A430ALK5_9ENTE|nr:response regulator transcription factor [Vagococcus acidifermentans]RSU08975.1 DNA-binding response regulator [Vagococcus acidifermentans]